MKLNHLRFLLITCLVSSCYYHPIKAQVKEEFETLFDQRFADDEPGGSILVKKGDQVVFLNSYGLSDLQTKERITENTIFNTGSISKTFVSYGILILEEQGKLSLNDNLYQYFSDFDHSELARKVKIKHLMSHTSGIPDARDVHNNRTFYITAKDEGNFEPIKRIDALNFEPGVKYQYSNPAFNGLALIIEGTSKQKWQQFIKERIFDPADMKQSRITDGAHPEEGVAHGYTAINGEFTEDDYGEVPTFAAAGNGGVWCSVLDLAKYEKAIRNFAFLGEEGIGKSRQVFHPDNWEGSKSPELGFSWFISEKETNRLGVDRISHTGSQGGFRSFYIAIPEKDILYIGLFNRPPDNMDELINIGIEILANQNWLD